MRKKPAIRLTNPWPEYPVSDSPGVFLSFATSTDMESVLVVFWNAWVLGRSTPAASGTQYGAGTRRQTTSSSSIAVIAATLAPGSQHLQQPRQVGKQLTLRLLARFTV